MKQRLVTQTDERSLDNPIQKSNSVQNQFQILQVVGNVLLVWFIWLLIQKLMKKLLLRKKHLIIQELTHPCIVQLRQAFFTQNDNQKNTDDIYLNLVMDYIPETLSKLIKVNFQIYYLKYTVIRCQELQLIYKIGIGICHRDIKPQNILVNPNSHVLKFCDFGSAKRLIPGEPNVAYICSRYYRAPELIFGATEYTTSIDIWSIGCVIVEMLTGEPLFSGESATDQLVEIIKMLGTPTIEQIKQMNPKQGFCIPNVQQPNFFDFQKEELQIQPEIAPKLTPSWFKKKLQLQ